MLFRRAKAAYCFGHYLIVVPRLRFVLYVLSLCPAISGLLNTYAFFFGHYLEAGHDDDDNNNNIY